MGAVAPKHAEGKESCPWRGCRAAGHSAQGTRNRSFEESCPRFRRLGQARDRCHQRSRRQSQRSKTPARARGGSTCGQTQKETKSEGRQAPSSCDPLQRVCENVLRRLEE